MMRLDDYLHAQGLGSRRFCRRLAQTGAVAVNGQTLPEDAPITPENVQTLTIHGEARLIRPVPYFYLRLNKPADYETSKRPSAYPSVWQLLSPEIRQDAQALGRLDADTEGVLIFTNDGAFNHHLTHPKHHIEKEYRVHLKHPAAPDLCAKLKAGVELHDDGLCVARAATLETPQRLRLLITGGKYHQVKRMIAAAGNRVEYLERLRFHHWRVDDLARGEWAFFNPNDAA